MTRPLARTCLLLIVALLAPSAAHAAPIVAGQFTVDVVLRQSVELLPGTPFNPFPVPITIQADAAGTLTVTRQMQMGSTIVTSPYVQLAGFLPGPTPIPYEIFAGTADLPPTVGVISNVVQDPNDPGFASGDPSSFVSGDFREEAYFKQVIAALGATVYSDPNTPAVFTATLTGLPYPEGTVFTSPGRVNLYLQLGAVRDPATDLLIGQSFDRVLTVVPEPTSFALMAGASATAVGAAGWRRRRGAARA